MNIHLVLNGEQQGPFTPDEVRKLLAEGKATPATLAWHEGLAGWMPVSTVLAALPSVGGSPPPPPVAPAAQKKGLGGCAWTAIIIACVAVVGLPVFACLAGIALGPITQGIKQAKESASMQQSRTIALAMFSYSLDNNGNYPTGQSSTEVFQKLLDGNYVSSPDTFYVAMPGKVKPTGGKLTAANVCFDVTANVTAQSPSTLPVVFLTGYTIDYAAGGNATPNSALSVPFPGTLPRSGGISVAYKSNNAFFMNCGSGGIIPHIVPADFEPGTTTYRQLTP